MSQETPKVEPKKEYTGKDPESWHGPISGREERAEFSFFSELAKNGFAVEKLYKNPSGDVIYEVRQLIKDDDGEVTEGPVLRFENETLVSKLMDKDEKLRTRVREYLERFLQPGAIVLDSSTPSVLLNPLPGEDTKKGN